jgi:hypothetical protein
MELKLLNKLRKKKDLRPIDVFSFMKQACRRSLWIAVHNESNYFHPSTLSTSEEQCLRLKDGIFWRDHTPKKVKLVLENEPND